LHCVNPPVTATLSAAWVANLSYTGDAATLAATVGLVASGTSTGSGEPQLVNEMIGLAGAVTYANQVVDGRRAAATSSYRRRRSFFSRARPEHTGAPNSTQ
jgi:hypothetical protein